MKGKTFVSIAAAVIWLAAGSLLFAADPALGTWKLNVAKSKYSGPAPKSATLTFEAVGDSVKRSGEQIAADGKKSSLSYTAKIDGKYYPVTGSALYDEIAIKRVNDHNTEATMKRAGKLVANAKRSVSSDGKSMTITMSGTNAKGERVDIVSVYDKQ